MSYFCSGFRSGKHAIGRSSTGAFFFKSPTAYYYYLLFTAFFCFCFFIIDVDECTASSSMCHENAFCKNTLGSYNCTCKPRYYGDGKTCKGKIGRCLHNSSFQSPIGRDVTTRFSRRNSGKPECYMLGVARNDLPNFKFFKYSTTEARRKKVVQK